MTLVAFQDIGDFMRLGCYSLVENIEGSANTQYGELSDLVGSNIQRKVLFRSMSAGLAQCSCDLMDKKVAIITLTRKAWEANSDTDDHYLQTYQPVEKCMHCRIVKEVHRRGF